MTAPGSGGHHHHHHGPAPRGPAGLRRLTLLFLVPAALLTALGMLLLWPSSPPAAAPPAEGLTRYLGEVRAVTPGPCAETPDPSAAPGPSADLICGTVTVRLSDGSQVTADIPNGPGAVEVKPGDDIVLLRLLDGEGGVSESYSIIDHQRGQQLWVLGAAFALAVIAFGRWRGVTALAGLGLTFAVLLLFVVPAILDGRSPVLVAVVGAAAIMLTVLYLTHGFTVTTSVAVAGTLVSLTITALLSAAATAGIHLSGVVDDAANYLSITEGQINMRGLLLAGIVIGSLGVLDDVTVTQSATVAELSQANPSYGFRQLYSAATRVGRAHIASVINTIVLAYAGASLPLMLLFATGGTPVSELLTGQLVAQELVRSAVGTIGLITAVPITTALAAYAATRATRPAPEEPARPAPPPDDPWAAFADRHA
ncbi:YibE/F family protein [Actinoplanes sp. M2I2]|uniref:YibE/F family protein n=1 Tax=Actinoplanes sp. M2I2 TaxID=1734444 RepID=UPI002021D17B|nr:YibE/F family protein [Actinoplanes sp. M2I2]